MSEVQRISGLEFQATVKPGWLAVMTEIAVVLTKPSHPPYHIKLDTIVEGDELPRDNDAPIAGW